MSPPSSPPSNGPARPDPRPERTVQRRPQPGQGQPGRRRLLRRRRQAAGAALRGQKPRSSCWPRPRPRATCPSTASPPTTRRCRAWCSAPTAPWSRRPRGHRAGPGRHRRPEGGRRFPEALNPGAKVLISDPSWENHRALFTNAGFAVGTYPYYDAATRGVRFDAMLAALQRAPRRHRRRAARLLPQPDRLRHHAGAVGTGGAPARRAAWCLPGHGLPGLRRRHRRRRRRDRQFLATGIDFFVSTSFSKSFSLYGERVGALSVVCASKDEARACCRS
jgi:hypothetical protein